MTLTSMVLEYLDTGYSNTLAALKRRKVLAVAIRKAMKGRTPVFVEHEGKKYRIDARESHGLISVMTVNRP